MPQFVSASTGSGILGLLPLPTSVGEMRDGRNAFAPFADRTHIDYGTNIRWRDTTERAKNGACCKFANPGPGGEFYSEGGHEDADARARARSQIPAQDTSESGARI